MHSVHQAHASCRNSQQRSWQNLRRTANIVAACIIAFLGFAFEGSSQAPSDRREKVKEGDGPLQCATKLERLSRAIEAYLGDREEQRKMPVSEFAGSLESALPVSGCDTYTVKKVLMRNSFFRMTPSVMSNSPKMGIRFANDERLIVLLWSHSLQTFKKHGTYGKVKMSPFDYRY